MEDRLKRIADDIIDREGGFVDDPDDPGGATKYGVSLRALRGLAIDVDQNGHIDADDIRAITREQARQIFIQTYFYQPRIAILPNDIQAVLFDSYVHMGSQSVVILQRLLQALGHILADDGIIGPQTAQATARACAKDSQLFCDSYSIERRNFYLRLGDQKPQFRKYIRRRTGRKGGWITRAEGFLSARYHLTQQEFSKRVAKWV